MATLVLLLSTGAIILAFVTAEGWLLLHLMQQNGRLLLRMDTLEVGRASSSIRAPTLLATPEPVPAPDTGLRLGSVAPGFSLTSLDGVEVSLADLRAPGRSVVLIFTDPGCGPCSALVPDFSAWQRDHATRFTMAFVSRGSIEANTTRYAEHGLAPVLLQQRAEVAELYNSRPTPSAVLIWPNGTIASRAARGAAAVRSLISRAINEAEQAQARPAPANGAAQARPRGLPVGTKAPDIALPNLAGEMTTLDQVRGERALVLFWNPGCGFCKRMLGDMRAWEANPPADAPRLLVVSTGTVEANLAAGWRAPVVLDQGFVTARTFGASGTPSAVLVDADGRIASALAVGAPAVLALTGSSHLDPSLAT